MTGVEGEEEDSGWRGEEPIPPLIGLRKIGEGERGVRGVEDQGRTEEDRL